MRLSGGVSTVSRQRDPENRLWWRRPARRLEAEIIRDSLLAVSGTLDLKTYGKGTLDQKTPRRSIYLTVKRGQLIPFLQLFDAPDAMQGVGRRSENAVAPQALAMLNSPFVREFAVRTPGDPEAIVRRGLERGLLAGVSLSRFPGIGAPDGLLLAFTEKRTLEEIDLLIDVLRRG